MARQRRAEEWWDSHPDVLRCTAHYKSNGKQCGVQATPGTNVCNQHGALIPAVREAAARRIQMSVDDAVKRLHEMLDDPQAPHAVKAKILHDLLDRGGLGATSKHLVGVVTQDPVEKLFKQILADPDGLMQISAAPPPLDPEFEEYNRAAREDDYPSDIVDAEVVEEPVRARPVIPPRAISDGEHNTTLPPKHIRDDLDRLGIPWRP